MKKYTVCLYDGSVSYIQHPVASVIVEAEDFKLDPLKPFYDIVEITDSCTTYKNRITNKCFNVYYYRALHLAENIRSYDFGSYSRFCVAIEGEYTTEEVVNIVNSLDKMA